jgi:hypothetical protein
VEIRVWPHFKRPFSVPAAVGTGGHWGGDPALFSHLFAENEVSDPDGRSAGPEQGAASVLAGIAGNQSLAESRPVAIGALLPLAPGAERLSQLQ